MLPFSVRLNILSQVNVSQVGWRDTLSNLSYEMKCAIEVQNNLLNRGLVLLFCLVLHGNTFLSEIENIEELQRHKPQYFTISSSCTVSFLFQLQAQAEVFGCCALIHLGLVTVIPKRHSLPLLLVHAYFKWFSVLLISQLPLAFFCLTTG